MTIVTAKVERFQKGFIDTLSLLSTGINCYSITESGWDSLQAFCDDANIKAMISPDGIMAKYICMIFGISCLIDMWYDDQLKEVTYHFEPLI